MVVELFVELEASITKPGPGSGVTALVPFSELGPGLGKTTSRLSTVLQPLPTLQANMSGSSSIEF